MVHEHLLLGYELLKMYIESMLIVRLSILEMKVGLFFDIIIIFIDYLNNN